MTLQTRPLGSIGMEVIGLDPGQSIDGDRPQKGPVEHEVQHRDQHGPTQECERDGARRSADLTAGVSGSYGYYRHIRSAAPRW